MPGTTRQRRPRTDAAGPWPGRPDECRVRDAAESVAGYVVQRDLRDIVLVGHSGGGVAISHTVEIIADRVQRLVYLSG